MDTLSTINLDIFPKEREKRLKEIYRYSLFETMIYRSNLWMHEHRVSWIAEVVAGLLKPHLSLDIEKAKTLALVHDDAEIITGDVQLGHKAQMTKEQLAELDREEERAIETLSAQYPSEINGYSYKTLLLEALHKNTAEAQVCSYADKFDAYCEGIHEQLAGNITLLTSTILYTRFFAQVDSKLPLISEALNKAEPSPFIRPFIQSPSPGKQITVAMYKEFSGKPHTEESINKTTERYPFYDAWKKLVLERGGEEGKRWLLIQKETLPT